MADYELRGNGQSTSNRRFDSLNQNILGDDVSAALRRELESLSLYLLNLGVKREKELNELKKKYINEESEDYAKKRRAIEEEIREDERKAQERHDKFLADQQKKDQKLEKDKQKQLGDYDKLRRMAQAREDTKRRNERIALLKEEENANKEAYASLALLYKEQILHATKLGDKIAANGNSYAENILNAVSKAINAIGGSVEKYLGTYTQYMSGIEARILDSGLTYKSLNETLRRNTAANPFIRYTLVLERLNTLVGMGIADNVALRAFLDTISDKIATTFDATLESLLRIIRIQGGSRNNADTTAARLGLEASLTSLFNRYFGDTSYLSNLFDNVQSILIDVSSQLSAQSSVELEYIVLKWLGVLSSVGVTDQTVSQLAQGIAYLGSGNIGALSSNTALLNLLVMGINRGGTRSYAEMLTLGVTSADVNLLLYNIIGYIRDISTSSNNVVKAQFAELFGVSISDLTAFNNITKNELDLLKATAMTYQDTLLELSYLLSQVSSRVHISEQIDNIIDNTLAGIGMGVANNTAAYAIYKAADVLESITGGIRLPYISALGSGVDLNMSLEGLVKGGVIGWSTVNQLMLAISSLSTLGLDLSGWEMNLNFGRGFNRNISRIGELDTTMSSVAFVSNTNATGSLQSLVDQLMEAGKTVLGEDRSATEKIDAIIEFVSKLWYYFEKGGSDHPLLVEVNSVSESVRFNLASNLV